MATRNAIDRLTRRIDAIAVRRCGRLSIDSLTDEAWLKIEPLLAVRALALAGRHQGPSIGPTTICFAFSSSRAILTAADFKGNTNGDANGG